MPEQEPGADQPITLSRREIDSFRSNGYLELGRILNDSETRRYQEIFDRDRDEMRRHWYPLGHRHRPHLS